MEYAESDRGQHSPSVDIPRIEKPGVATSCRNPAIFIFSYADAGHDDKTNGGVGPGVLHLQWRPEHALPRSEWSP